MKINKFNSKFWLKYSIAIVMLIVIFAYALRINDSAFDGLDYYIKHNNEIEKIVGSVNKYRVANTRYMSATSDQNIYHEYKVILTGEKNVATVKIRADEINDASWKYTILKVYK